MTNREHLNGLSDEDFAHSMRYGFLCYRCSHGGKKGKCKIKALDTKKCDEGITEWLKKEYKGEE